ncbi:MAG TPA: hypothetical protein VKR58_01535 [Aquella sp.]|nr:hypothetical protein [Aquella sp.]
MEKMVNIVPFNLVKTDERGVTSDFSLCRPQAQFMFFTRKDGSLSGNTYHEGKNSGTSPKAFILLSGKLYLNYRKVGTSQKFQNLVTAPAIIEVQPLVIHNFEAIEDITFIECNSLQDLQDDKIKEIV